MKKSQAVLLTMAGTLLVLALTLWPSPGEAGSRLDFWCFFCGTRDAADAVLNVILFIPMGVGLAALCSSYFGRRVSPTGRRAPSPARRTSLPGWRTVLFTVLGSFTVSALVELAQTNLAGRHPSLEDLVFNTAGGLLGAVLLVVLLAPHRGVAVVLLKPPGVLRAGGLLFPLLIFAFSSLLSRPQVPARALYGQWAHELGRMIPYPGRILSATSGEVSVPDAMVSAQEALSRSLTGLEPIEITAVAGPVPQTLSHFFAIYDDQQEEVLLMAVQGPDLIFQRRTFSVGLLFDQPLMRWEGIFDFEEGDTVRVGLAQDGGVWPGSGPCLVVGEARNCTLAAGVEGGWRLLHRLSAAPPWIVAILGAFWLMVLSFPTGLLVYSRPQGSLPWVVAWGFGIGAIAALMSWLTPWLGFHLVQLWAPIVGVGLGWIARRGLSTNL